MEAIERWLAEASIQSLWPWQRAGLEALAAGQSWVCTFPTGGGRGLFAALASQLPGRVWLITADHLLLERRAQQAEALGIATHTWDGGESAQSEEAQASQLWLLHTSSLAGLESDALQSQLAASDSAYVLLDAPMTEATPPTWWEALSSASSRGVLPSASAPKGWWSSADAGLQTLASDASWGEAIGDFGIEETDVAPHAWRQQHDRDEGPTWWLQVPTTQAAPDAVQVPGDPSTLKEQRAQLTSPESHAFVLERCSDAPAYLAAPTHVYFGAAPARLQDLSIAAIRGRQLWLQTSDDAQETTSNAAEDRFVLELLKHLQELAKEAPEGYIYQSSSELLMALGKPISPQPAFDKAAQQLHSALEALKQQGALHSLEIVHFQVKLHNTQKFKEAFVKDDAVLHQFWQHYQQMQGSLSPMDALKLSFRNGQHLDLRELSHHMPYSVHELNHVLTQLIDKGVLLAALGDALGRFDHEFQMAVGRPQLASFGVRLWMQSKALQKPLLQAAAGHAALSDAQEEALRRFLSSAPTEPAHWEAAMHLIGPEASRDDAVAMAGKALAILDHAPSQHGLLLWLCAGYHLDLPALEKASLRQAFPQPKHAPETIKPMLRWLLDVDHENFKHYVLDLKDPSGFEAAMEAYLQDEAENILKRNSSHRARGALHRYGKLSKLWMKQQAEGEGSTAPWAAAAGWAAFLQGQKQPAWEWMAPLLDASDKTELVHWRLTQVAIGNKQWDAAKQLFFSAPEESPLNQQQHNTLLRDLYNGLHQLCRKTPQGEASPYQGTPLFPADIDGILRLPEEHPAFPKEHLQESLAKRLHADLKDADTASLRKLLEAPFVADSRRLQRQLYAKLADQGAAEPAELEELATWHDRAGRRDQSLAIRKQLLEKQPDNAQNLHRLAVAAVYQDDMAQAFQWALEANRAEPQRFPLERFVERNRDRCLADTNALKELLIELPAHPAFRALEEELEAMEALQKKLKPLQQQAEAAIEAKKYGDAKAIIKPILREHKQKAPAAFEELKAQIVAVEASLLQRISRIPHRDHKKRNQHLEAVAQEAMEFGLQDIADEAYQKLVKFNPQYGLGFLKLARTATDPSQRKEAYQKAIDLSKTPQQRQRNMAEYITALEEEGKTHEILPLLIEIADSFPDEIPKVVAPLMVKLVENLGADPVVTKGVEEFLAGLDDPKPFRRVRQALGQMEEMEPWKRALMSIKTN